MIRDPFDVASNRFSEFFVHAGNVDTIVSPVLADVTRNADVRVTRQAVQFQFVIAVQNAMTSLRFQQVVCCASSKRYDDVSPAGDLTMWLTAAIAQFPAAAGTVHCDIFNTGVNFVFALGKAAIARHAVSRLTRNILRVNQAFDEEITNQLFNAGVWYHKCSATNWTIGVVAWAIIRAVDFNTPKTKRVKTGQGLGFDKVIQTNRTLRQCIDIVLQVRCRHI